MVSIKKSKIDYVKDKFHWKSNEPDLYNYGTYRLGLTSEEIDDYLRARSGKMMIKSLRKKFNEIAGCNTMAVAPTGESLMYHHDVHRYADVLFRKTQGTYFD